MSYRRRLTNLADNAPGSRPAPPPSDIDDQGVFIDDFDLPCSRPHAFIVWVNRSANCELKGVELVSASGQSSRDVTHLLPEPVLEELRLQAEDYWRREDEMGIGVDSEEAA